MYTFDENIVSDLHKEARSFRPRETFWSFWNNSTDAQKQVIWDDLLAEAASEAEQEQVRKEQATKRFEHRIAETIALGAPDEETALSWLLDAEKFTLYDYQYGASYIAYHFDLPYENKWSTALERITKEKADALLAAETT